MLTITIYVAFDSGDFISAVVAATEIDKPSF